jgi:hypothetical protein
MSSLLVGIVIIKMVLGDFETRTIMALVWHASNPMAIVKGLVVSIGGALYSSLLMFAIPFIGMGEYMGRVYGFYSAVLSVKVIERHTESSEAITLQYR